MKRRVNVNKIRLNKLMLIFIVLFFGLVIFRLSYLSLAGEIDGVNIKSFVANRNTRKKTIYAKRGSIYDTSGNVLAQTVNSYTVIAYLSESRSNGFKTPQHVVDKEYTAEKLSPILGMSEEAILYLLDKNAYQVELGPGGRDITELKKEQIEELKLPGISFISSYKRYYQNGDFASYILGYVKTTDDGELIGEMGVESYYNDMLSGEDGYVIYQQDAYGYKLPNTREETKESIDGADIYLTIDSNIQFFVEKYTKEAYETYNPEWAITVVADAKTGAILGSTSYPSFDPNIKNITNWLNPLVSFSFEPGSTMKIFTYMAAMEEGVYKGSDTFKSGSIKFGKNEIFDWKTDGFGEITYDDGFLLSSNVGISYLTKDYFKADKLKKYFQDYGFGSKTNIELYGELTGSLNMDRLTDVEIANAGFGQGITITPIQMIQALTMIANDGVMLKPYIIDKIVGEANEIIYQGSKEELGKKVSTSTVNNIKNLMYDVIYNDLYYSTGVGYKMNGYDLMGKTGTAQYVNESTGKYYFDSLNYIRSFAGLFPKEDPEIIIYTLMKKTETSKGIQNIVKGLVKDISNYKSIYNPNIKTDATTYKIDNYLNKNISTVKKDLESKFNNIIVIGNGDKVTYQYPVYGTVYGVDEKVYIITNGSEIVVPNMNNWSKKEVKTYCNLSNITCNIEGSGFVYEQEIIDDVYYFKLKNDMQEE